MATIYRAKDGDTLDRIMWLVYAAQSDALLNGLFDANPGIAETAVLAAGMAVTIPDAETVDAATISEVRLWD